MPFGFQLLAVLCQVSLQAAGDVMVAYGMRRRPIAIPWVIVGTLTLGSGFGLFMLLLRYLPLSVVAPAGAACHLVVALLSRVFLHEDVSRLRWTGALLVAFGVMLVLRSQPPPAANPPALPARIAPASLSSPSGEIPAPAPGSSGRVAPAGRDPSLPRM